MTPKRLEGITTAEPIVVIMTLNSWRPVISHCDNQNTLCRG
jgi:hypothetical protein